MSENNKQHKPAHTSDWMEYLLQSPIFQKLKPANLQQIMLKLEEVHYKKGEVIFNQGDEGDYFYLVREGRCTLGRKASERSKPVQLLELGENETFGEDSLLSGETRSLTVSALTDMMLSRIDKDSFINLIKIPVLIYIRQEEIAPEIANGAALLDIRPGHEYSKKHIKGARNIPFFSLRIHVQELKSASKVIVVCKDGALSEAAAFVLLKQKIEVCIVQDGMNGITDLSVGELPSENESAITLQEEIEDPKFSLEQENQELKRELETLKIEMALLGKQNRILTKQTNKLKAVLDMKLNVTTTH